MKKAVIFDVDDTLCNTSQAVAPALQKVFTDNLVHFPGKTVTEMMELDRKAFEELFRHPEIPIPSATILIWFRIFEYLHIKPPVKAIYHMIEQFREEYMKHIDVHEGLLDFMQSLQENHIKIGTLTNGTFMEQAKKIILLGLDRYIDYFVATDMTLVDKPQKKAFTYVLTKLETKPEETVMIGDLLELDIIGAHEAGLKTIWFAKEQPKIIPKQVNKVITSYKELSLRDLLDL